MINHKSKLILFLTLAVICCSQLLSAQTHRLHWNPGSTGNQTAGKATYIEAIFDTATNRFKWEANFENTRGCLPDSFFVVVNGTGRNPKGLDGELAIFYLDATNASDLRLTTYAYNARSSSNSYLDGSIEAGIQAPDPIISSVNNSSFVTSLVRRDEADGTRTLGFDIDATTINYHRPIYPDPDGNPWSGARFTKKLGMWFHPVCNTQTEYHASGELSGFLSKYNFSVLGSYDTSSQNTQVENPVCSTEQSIFQTVKIGEEITVDFMITDPQGDDVMINSLQIPEGATITADSTFGSSPRTATFTWTPTASDGGTSTIVAISAKDTNLAGTTCGIFVRVPENVKPICDAGASFAGLDCNGESQVISLRGSNSTDPDNSPGSLQHSWSTNCPLEDSSHLVQIFSLAQVLVPTTTGNNMPVSCQATLTVSDGIDSTSCSTPISFNSCERDCAGTINGSETFDDCGVCGGDNSSCSDCSGEPFGTTEVDQCGVCGGDNQSCISCTSSSIQSNIAILDNGSQSILALVQRNAGRIRAIRGGLNKRDEVALNAALDAHSGAWLAVNSLPATIVTCTSGPTCVGVSHVSNVDAYSLNTANLRSAGLKVAKRLRKALRKSGKSQTAARRQFTKARRNLNKLFDATVIELANVPTSTDVCL